MLTDIRKIKTVELWLQGKTKVAIAKEIGVTRQTVAEWLKDPEIIKQINEGHEDLIQAAKNRLTDKLDDYLNILDERARDSSDKRTSAQCAIYLTDRILGKVGAIPESTEDKHKDETSEDLIDKYLKEIEE